LNDPKNPDQTPKTRISFCSLFKKKSPSRIALRLFDLVCRPGLVRSRGAGLAVIAANHHFLKLKLWWIAGTLPATADTVHACRFRTITLGLNQLYEDWEGDKETLGLERGDYVTYLDLPLSACITPSIPPHSWNSCTTNISLAFSTRL
jgi:hypothetical protein